MACDLFGLAAAILLAALLTGCVRYSKVHERRNTASLAVTATQRDTARQMERRPPDAHLGGYLAAAQSALVQLKANPQSTLSQSDYNFAVSRVVECLARSDAEPWKRPVSATGPDGRKWVLTLKAPDERPEFHPSGFRVMPADRYRFTGRLVGDRLTKLGIGAPVVAVSKEHDLRNVRRLAEGKDFFYGLTGVLRFEGNRCELQYYDPLEVEDVSLAGHKLPLAADFQAPLAMALAELQMKRRELDAFLSPKDFEGSAKLIRLQPYAPEKIPVLFIHGLLNSPATWVPVIDFLRGDPQIRQNYQFWVFGYATGLPYPITAELLRRHLDEIKALYPGHKEIVVVGHSMGGMISRLLLTQSNGAIWDHFFDKPPEAIPFSPDVRRIIVPALKFQPRKDISRVVFVSASHRGSDMAVGLIGRIGSLAAGNPITEDRINKELVEFVRPEARAKGRPRLPNAIDLLDPGHPFLHLVDSLPADPSIPYHSLIGDRGRGGFLDRTWPTSSDGIVPYWSSHLQGAKSERVIPSGHWSHLHPLGLAEIKRLLVLHLADPS